MVKSLNSFLGSLGAHGINAEGARGAVVTDQGGSVPRSADVSTVSQDDVIRSNKIPETSGGQLFDQSILGLLTSGKGGAGAEQAR